MTRLIALFLALLLVALLVTGQPPMDTHKWGVVTVLIEPSIMTATVAK